MAVLDNKGRLFGKFNLLDLAVVLVVLAVVARFGYQAYQGRQVAPVGNEREISVVMRFASVAEATTKWVKVGDEMYDSKSRTYLGKVTAVRSEPALVVVTSEDGRSYEHLSKHRFDFYVTVTGPGRVSPNGVTMGGFEMVIGRTNYVRTALWSGYGVTWDMQNLGMR